jgi:hypothetical protein
MGTEFLVAGLWGAVLVYWLWSRRPTTSDTVGVFRRELRVLEGATPARVAPANRRCTGLASAPAPGTPTPLAAAALCHKRMEVRRRRRDVLAVLSAAVALTLAVSVLTWSNIAWALQGACDIALCGYLYLLVRATRSKAQAAVGHFVAPVRAAVLDEELLLDLRPFAAEVARRRPEPRPEVAAYVPAHALRSAQRASSGAGAESYGDFDSYASLALAGAN